MGDRLFITKALRDLVVLMFLSAQLATSQATGTIHGKVTDTSGAAILGAVVTAQADGVQRTTVTDADGVFLISWLGLGNYSLKISAAGLSDWTAASVPASADPESSPVTAVLPVAQTVTSVTVGAGPEEVAAAQLKQELKQRALGVIPNYYVSYNNNAAPLSAKQKLHLGMRLLFDPTTFAVAGISAGIQQQRNSYFEYGQGTEGFAKRYGATYGTAASSTLITAVLLDSVLHQDPRYFYAGKAYGNRPKRALYAIRTAFRAKGDNGKWQPPYADLIGLVASAELSATYLPGSRTQYTLLGRSLMFRFAGRIAIYLTQELLLKKVTSNVPDAPSASNLPLLREGTPVELIAVDGLSANGVTAGKAVSFVLAQELVVDGKIVAKTGEVASGQVGRISAGASPDAATNIGLEGVTLRIGATKVPLRSGPVRGVAGPMQYKESPGSGKMTVTLYVAQSMRLTEYQ